LIHHLHINVKKQIIIVSGNVVGASPSPGTPELPYKKTTFITLFKMDLGGKEEKKGDRQNYKIIIDINHWTG
jgi:hypothetical protein